MNTGKIVVIVILIVALFISAYLLYDIYITLSAKQRNFTINYTKMESQLSYSSSSQIYPNIRFNHNNISYLIEADCAEQNKEDMAWAFYYIENKTNIINFYPAQTDADIEIRCGEEYKQGELFVAGEGGPSAIINTGLFNIIVKGEIALLNSDSCSHNVALHELLHVFGFKHSDNPESIMYNVTSCNQALTNDITAELLRLYSIPALPDLYFENITGSKKGVYADLVFVIKNQGLADSKNIDVVLYAENKSVDSFNLGDIEAGAGKKFSIKNEKVGMSVSSLRLVIEDSEELDTKNNEAILSVS